MLNHSFCIIILLYMIKKWILLKLLEHFHMHAVAFNYLSHQNSTIRNHNCARNVARII